MFTADECQLSRCFIGVNWRGPILSLTNVYSSEIEMYQYVQTCCGNRVDHPGINLSWLPTSSRLRKCEWSFEDTKVECGHVQTWLRWDNDQSKFWWQLREGKSEQSNIATDIVPYKKARQVEKRVQEVERVQNTSFLHCFLISYLCWMIRFA